MKRFSRAFKEVFEVPPSEYRALHQSCIKKRKEPLLMEETAFEAIDDPRIETRSGMCIVGLKRVYSDNESAAGIPSQWQNFVPHLGHIPGQQSDETYGVCQMLADGMQYVCGVEVPPNPDVPAELFRLDIEPQTYAVFKHEGHVSTIRQTWVTIFQKWLPEANVIRANAPDFEWYSSDFDPVSGKGRIEIWIPLESE